MGCSKTAQEREVRYLAHESLRSARSCLPLASSVPIGPRLRDVYLLGRRSLIQLPQTRVRETSRAINRDVPSQTRLSQVSISQVSNRCRRFCTSVEISTNTSAAFIARQNCSRRNTLISKVSQGLILCTSSGIAIAPRHRGGVRAIKRVSGTSSSLKAN